MPFAAFHFIDLNYRCAFQIWRETKGIKKVKQLNVSHSNKRVIVDLETYLGSKCRTTFSKPRPFCIPATKTNKGFNQKSKKHWREVRTKTTQNEWPREGAKQANMKGRRETCKWTKQIIKKMRIVGCADLWEPIQPAQYNKQYEQWLSKQMGRWIAEAKCSKLTV